MKCSLVRSVMSELQTIQSAFKSPHSPLTTMASLTFFRMSWIFCLFSLWTNVNVFRHKLGNKSNSSS